MVIAGSIPYSTHPIKSLNSKNVILGGTCGNIVRKREEGEYGEDPHLIWGETLEHVAGALLRLVLDNVGEGDTICTRCTSEYVGVRVPE